MMYSKSIFFEPHPNRLNGNGKKELKGPESPIKKVKTVHTIKFENMIENMIRIFKANCTQKLQELQTEVATIHSDALEEWYKRKAFFQNITKQILTEKRVIDRLLKENGVDNFSIDETLKSEYRKVIKFEFRQFRKNFGAQMMFPSFQEGLRAASNAIEKERNSEAREKEPVSPSR